MDEILRVRLPTLRHVPKAARDDWARLVGDVLSSVSTSMQEIDDWCKVFMLARCILANPPRGGRLHWRDTLRLVRSRIQMWREGKIAELWEAVVLRDREFLSHRTKKKATPSTASLHQAMLFVHGGQLKMGSTERPFNPLPQQALPVSLKMLFQ